MSYTYVCTMESLNWQKIKHFVRRKYSQCNLFGIYESHRQRRGRFYTQNVLHTAQTLAPESIMLLSRFSTSKIPSTQMKFFCYPYMMCTFCYLHTICRNKIFPFHLMLYKRFYLGKKINHISISIFNF